MSELLERLGGAPDGRGLIITCDNLGQSHAANAAIAECLDIGVATAASLMVPCPWARDAARRFAQTPVGVDLTLNAEFDNYRWAPITQAPSLLDGDGGFPRTPADAWEHSDLDEVHRECRAQIERAGQWGSDLTHLCPHLDTLLLRPEFFDVYLELATEMALPVRLGGADQERRAGFPFRRLAEEAGVLAPDHVVHLRGRPARHTLEQAVADLAPGVTEIVISPAIDTPELREMDPGWLSRVEQYLLVAHDAALAGVIQRSGVTMLTYTDLREAQRDGAGA
ncbi:ChbG/HpnK family deacetylase [Candidatus Poriferisocius sp.]|uniref:ChbG/HpnK family deacetylase n=1 Tax=Candidatus Poriferisocius sp. TaxID=3101276 RepID=UPI003B5C90A5